MILTYHVLVTHNFIWCVLFLQFCTYSVNSLDLNCNLFQQVLQTLCRTFVPSFRCQRHLANLWAIACSPGKSTTVQWWGIGIYQSQTSSFKRNVCFVFSKANKNILMYHNYIYITLGHRFQKSQVKLQNTCSGSYPFDIKRGKDSQQEHNQHKIWGSSCSARGSFLSKNHLKGRGI